MLVTQGLVPYQLDRHEHQDGLTGLCGLPVYLDLAHVLGLSRSIDRHVTARDGGRGWSDTQIVMSLVLLNLAGGDCVEDLAKLQGDSGLSQLLGRVETAGIPRRERPALSRRRLRPTSATRSFVTRAFGLSNR
jgi:hypothetical protein